MLFRSFDTHQNDANRLRELFPWEEIEPRIAKVIDYARALAEDDAEDLSSNVEQTLNFDYNE